MFKNLNPGALGVSGHESEIVELALTYGFRGVDINVAEFAARVKLRGMAYARRLIDSTGGRLVLGTFPLPLDMDSADEVFKRELERLRHFGQVAGELGCTRCTTTIAPASDRRPYHENFEFHRQRLSEVAKALEPSGVRLAVGFRGAVSLRNAAAFQFIHDFDALSLLLQMIGAPNVGILLDVWDLYVSGGSIETIRGLSGPQIVALQLADAPPDQPLAGLGGEARLLPNSGGAIDLVAVLALLAERGYDGPVTPMPNRKTLDTTRRDAVVRAAGEGMTRLWRAAGLGPEAKVAAAAAK